MAVIAWETRTSRVSDRNAIGGLVGGKDCAASGVRNPRAVGSNLAHPFKRENEARPKIYLPWWRRANSGAPKRNDTSMPSEQEGTSALENQSLHDRALLLGGLRLAQAFIRHY